MMVQPVNIKRFLGAARQYQAISTAASCAISKAFRINSSPTRFVALAIISISYDHMNDNIIRIIRFINTLYLIRRGWWRFFPKQFGCKVPVPYLFSSEYLLLIIECVQFQALFAMTSTVATRPDRSRSPQCRHKCYVVQCSFCHGNGRCCFRHGHPTPFSRRNRRCAENHDPNACVHLCMEALRFEITTSPNPTIAENIKFCMRSQRSEPPEPDSESA